MSNFRAVLFVMQMAISGSIFLSLGCPETSEEEKMRQYLSAVNAQSGSAVHPGSGGGNTIPSLPALAGAAGGSATAIIAGTPRTVKDGFCGDGIINGPNEDCDQGAIQNTKCADYGALPDGGTVRCQPNCLYDISDCITPAVDRRIGGIAETCKCNCSSSLCQGGCRSTNMVAQSVCRFDCDNDCVCRCEGRMETHVESCEVQCACIIDAAGSPQCECHLDECEVLATIVPNIATLSTARSGGGH